MHRFVHQVKRPPPTGFFLPPYSPEINPDELVWNDGVKNHGRCSNIDPRPQQICIAQ